MGGPRPGEILTRHPLDQRPRSSVHVQLLDTRDMTPRKTIPEEVAELRAMDVPCLVQRYEALFGKPPRVRHKDWLWKRIAWKLQERRLGGLSKVAKARLEELIAEIELPLAESTAKPKASAEARRDLKALLPGTVLTRIWHDRQIRVRVLDNGFDWDGQVFKSLSAVARAVTGSHWNGRLFFGLTKRKKPR